MNWKEIVKSVAPVLGMALGGPLGGTAVKFLAGALLGDENASDAEAQLEQMMASASPDMLFKIKELDTTFKLEMKRLGIKETQLEVEDRDSARNMAVSTTMMPQMILSTIFVVAFTVILYTVFTSTIDLEETQKTIVIYLLGILSAGMIQIMNFWFGSSSGSKEKTAKLNL